MTRSEKKQFVEEFSKLRANYSCMVVVRQTKLDATAVAQLRKGAREQGVVFKVVKNTLAKIALKNESFAGTLEEAFSGSTGVILSNDLVSAAKVIDVFSKKREDIFFPIIGISLDEKIGADQIKLLATLPGLDQLRAQFLSLLNEPARRMARVLSLKAEEIL